MKRPVNTPAALLLTGDMGLGLAAYWLAFRIREIIPLPGTRKLLPPERFSVVEHRWFALVFLILAAGYLVDLYRELPGKRFRELAAGAVGASGLVSLGLVAVYFFAGDLVFPRTVVIIFWALDALALFAFRSIVLQFVRPPIARVVLVGRTRTAERLIDELRHETRSFRRVVGVLREEGDTGTEPYFSGVEVLGGIDAVPRLVSEGKIDEILLTPESDWRDRLLGEIAQLEGAGVRINVAPSLYEVLLGKLAHINLRDRPLLEVVRDPSDPLRDSIERIFDFVFAILLGVLALAIFVALYPLVRFSSRGPVLFRQKRVGRAGRVFTLLKFRTMIDEAERDSGAVLATDDDPRVTRLGRFLRKSRLDEIPQLWNVLAGEMSFVGPRPERPEFVEGFVRDIPGYSHRHRVRPGITGLAQVRGVYHTDASVKLMYDLIYVYNRSLWLDVLILLETLRTVLLGRGGA